MSEEWRPIPGYEGRYEVSDLGRVRSVARVIQRTTTPQRIRERILKPYATADGHLRVSLWVAGRGRTRDVHALVAAAFLGPRPDGMEVCHGDGDGTNNVLVNLRYDTRGANILDAVRHGTHHWASKTHCKHGHEFTPENTRPHPKGGRQCIKCALRHSADYRARKRGAVA